MAPPKWDTESDFKLLLAVVVSVDAKVPQAFFDNFVQKLDKGFSANGAYQRFYKLKREAEAILSKNDDTTGDAAPAGPSTPANKTTSAGTKKSTGKGRKRKTDADEEDDAAQASPTKSVKAKKTKSAKAVDAEDDAEADAGDAEEA